MDKKPSYIEQLNQNANTLVGAIVILIILVIGLTVFAAITQTPVQAQVGNIRTEIRAVTVTGMGRVNMPADTAYVNLGVQTTAETAGDALAENNSRMDTLLSSLANAGISSTDLQTQVVQLFPRYEQGPTPERGNLELVGFQAVNIVRVRINDLDDLGSILDQAIGAGATNIENIRFESSNPAEVVNEAHTQALADARQKATHMAAVVEGELGDLISIEEISPALSPISRVPESVAGGAVPIEPGQQTFEVILRVTWIIR